MFNHTTRSANAITIILYFLYYELAFHLTVTQLADEQETGCVSYCNFDIKSVTRVSVGDTPVSDSRRLGLGCRPIPVKWPKSTGLESLVPQGCRALVEMRSLLLLSPSYLLFVEDLQINVLAMILNFNLILKHFLEAPKLL